jgi:2-C-methyl-D-erythritol 4-phosphate cytidylyltransferase/2-C-methyl-D-erythritol 2,4-cyclodiphosphate synthase
MTAVMMSPSLRPPRVAALLVAAGRGLRAGGNSPKQYRIVGGKTVLTHALSLFEDHPRVTDIVVAIHPDDRASFAAASTGLQKVRDPAFGGETRQASGLAGLESLLGDPPDVVLIHDAARPFTSAELIDRAIDAALAHGAAAPGLPVTDTIKRVDEHGRVVDTPARSGLRAMQTPQSFRFDLILDAHRRAATAGVEGLTDDAAVAEWAGHPLFVFPGETGNMKLTHPTDFEAAEQRLARLAGLGDIRTGQGFDIHAFTDGDHVMLGGIRIPHSQGVAGHSDADVVLHAITDALLGAIGDGDIGSHFPPSDARWKGAASRVFVAHAVGLIAARGGAIAHIDVAIQAEAPKVGPHREAMRASIAEIAGVDVDRVAVKATTMEKLGAIGRLEGLSALAIATVRLPWSRP